MAYLYIRLTVACMIVFLCGVDAFSGQDVVLILDPGHGGRDQGGFNGHGFPLGDSFVPEDAYTYDVAKRIERLAAEKGLEVFFTVIDPEHDAWEQYYGRDLLLPRKKLLYNKPHDHTIVFNKKEGLQKRIDAVGKIRREHAHLKIIFISLHFDYAPDFTSGPKLLAPKSMVRHPFLKILSRTFEAYNLPYKVYSRKRLMVHRYDKLFMLRSISLEPRVLIELGNFNDMRDRSLMLTKEGRDMYAHAIMSALNEYISEGK